MPKLKKTDAQKDRDRLRRNLRVAQEVNSMTNYEMGDLIGRSKGTWDNRLENPDNLRWEEIRILCEKFGIDLAKFCAGELYQP